MLAHILDELTSIGIEEITFIVGYKGDMIRDYVTSNFKFKANFVEQPEMKGLGHAISLAKPHHYDDEPVLIVLGDTIFKAPLKKVFELKESALGVHKVEDGRRFGIVELSASGEVKRLVEKPEKPPTNLAIVGIYWMTNPKLLFDSLDQLITEGKTTKGEFQLTDALQKMLDKGERMRTFLVEGWYDCGKAETMLETNRDLLDGQMQGAPEHERVSHRYPTSVLIMPVCISETATVENCIVGPHVSISDNTKLRGSIVRNTIIGANSEVRSIILEDSIISDNAKVVGSQFKLNVGDSSEIVLG